MLHGSDLLTHQVDESIQHSRMRFHSIIMPAVKDQLIDRIREVKAECPVLIRRREAAVLGFSLHCRRQYQRDTLRPEALNHFRRSLSFQTHSVKVC